MNVFVANDGRIRSIWRFVLAVLVSYFANVVAAGFATTTGTGRLFELTYRLLALVFVLAGYSLLLVAADRVEGNPLPAMGLALRGPWLREMVMGLVLGFTLIVVAGAVIAVFGHLTFIFHFTYRATLALIAVLITLAAGAMLEEAMFRGYPFQRLVESVGSVAAVVLLSCLFGAAHLANPNASVWGFLNTVAVGVLFSIAYLRTRSLWMPWGIHFAWNVTLGVILGLPVSGIGSFAVFGRTKAAGPVWLTGGSYGIEASFLGTVVILLGIAALILLVNPSTPATPVPSPESQPGWIDHEDGNPPERIQI